MMDEIFASFRFQ